MPVTYPCGQCLFCRLRRSRDWSIRCMHELSLHSQSTAITLTYSPEHLPKGGSLQYRDFQLFMHSLRKKARRLHRQAKRPGSCPKIRFYMCGEYGDKNLRPHYHAMIFGFDFPDKIPSRKSKLGEQYHQSEMLDSLWGRGRTEVGTVNQKTAAYIARYIMKKQTGKMAHRTYWTSEIDEKTGEVFDRVPEFTHMSLKGGIGKGWLDKFATDVFPDDFVVMKGKEQPVPKYYVSQYEKVFPVIVKVVKSKRRFDALEKLRADPDQRLRVKEICLESKLKQLKRDYENDS